MWLLWDPVLKSLLRQRHLYPQVSQLKRLRQYTIKAAPEAVLAGIWCCFCLRDHLALIQDGGWYWLLILSGVDNNSPLPSTLLVGNQGQPNPMVLRPLVAAELKWLQALQQPYEAPQERGTFVPFPLPMGLLKSASAVLQTWNWRSAECNDTGRGYATCYGGAARWPWSISQHYF